MDAVGFAIAYPVAELFGAACIAVGCLAARRWPGRPALVLSRLLALVLLADAAAFLAPPLADGAFSVSADLPLQLCDMALLVAAGACWWPRWQLGIELTWFWGLAGCLQAVVTPDLYYRFGQLDWFVFVVGHLGVVMAALYLVLGLRRRPRPAAGVRVFAVTAGFTGCVALVDWLTGANYMYLRRIPGHASLLTLLGPWPYYIASAAGVAIVAFALLSAPFLVPRFLPHAWREHAVPRPASSQAARPPIGSGVPQTRTRDRAVARTR